jgi:hypothetical protein
MQGDSPWSIVVAPSYEDAVFVLDDRLGRGFNTIIAVLIEHLFAPAAPRNSSGDAPFTTPGDLATTSEAYFAHADRVLRAAESRGMLVLLAPLYLGYRAPHYPGFGNQAEGWYDEVLANGPEKCREYGRYLGRRYRDFPNLLWVMSGDRCPGPALAHIRALVAGIRETDDPRRLFTAHVHPGCKAVEEYPDDPWLEVNQVYTYGIVHRVCREEYERAPIRPFFLFESSYEGEHNASELQIRRQAYWPMLLGAFGQCFGTLPLWRFAEGWKQHGLDTPGARAMTVWRRLFDGRRWWDLVPDLDQRLVVGGMGELNGLDYCAAATTPDGRLAVAYVPEQRAITVDLGCFADAALRASWFDPLTGDTTDAGMHRPVGRRAFTPPWDHDAALVIESAE